MNLEVFSGSPNNCPMPFSRSLARFLIKASINSFTAEHTMLSSRNAKIIPMTTSRIFEPNMGGFSSRGELDELYPECAVPCPELFKAQGLERNGNGSVSFQIGDLGREHGPRVSCHC